MIPRDLIEAMGGRYPVADRDVFVASRFTYTYAYDFLRLAGVAASRGHAACKLREFCDERGLDREVVLLGLAYAYLNYYGIEKP